MKVAVIGAGKMGLPLACQFASRGAEVLACDLRQEVVDAINGGRCPIDEPGVAEILATTVREGRLRATTDTPAAVGDSAVVVVIVPAVLTAEREADLSALLAVTGQIAGRLRKGAMVSYETTVPVGTTRNRMLPLLESAGLVAGRDFDLVYSPERIKSRTVLQHLATTPKVVGGITRQAAARAAAFYQQYLGAPVLDLGTLEAAEMVKVAGMVYRDVNIALANELARYSEALSVDLEPVLEAANTDGETYLLHAGIGVGGHCTPVYPYFLIHDAAERGTPVTLAERGRRINDAQAEHMIDRLDRALGGLVGRRVLLLGLAFRPGVKEHLYSPAFLVRDELVRRGAEVRLHDPLYSELEIRAYGFNPGGLDDQPAHEAVVLITGHPEYAALDFAAMARAGTKAAVDGRSSWPPGSVRAAGVIYIGVGRPDSNLPTTPAASVPITRPFLGEAESAAAGRAVRSGWVAQGPEVAAFEREFAAFAGARHACAVSSCTVALHLALRALGVGPGDQVITVSHSFIATANSIRYCGALPVFVDIQPGTFNLDPALIERVITPATRAILCVHQIGMPCDLAAILEVARRHRLPVVEDAACAVGSEIRWEGKWEKIGRPHADIACFSFHPRKLVTTGDGGMLTTANPDWDRQFRLWRQHGMSVPDTVRHGSPQVIFEAYDELGYNYRMTDIQAAVGREQLRRLPQIVARRRAQAARYHRLLADVPGLGLPAEPAWARSNWQSYCVRLPQGRDQRQVMQAMLDAGIATRRAVMCAHREPAYGHEPWSCGLSPQECGCPPGPCSRLLESERAQDQAIVLPLYHQMSEADQERVAASLRRACQ